MNKTELEASWICDCLVERTDGLPPCGKVKVHKRLDGFYCDCGHTEKCCLDFRRQLHSAKGDS